jgi:hypothetical protein
LTCSIRIEALSFANAVNENWIRKRVAGRKLGLKGTVVVQEAAIPLLSWRNRRQSLSVSEVIGYLRNINSHDYFSALEMEVERSSETLVPMY